LLPRFRRDAERLEDEPKLERIVRASEAAARSSAVGATAAGDRRRLRGVPIIARAIGGAIPGHDPEPNLTDG
jgi:hypothetical protein